MGKNNKKKKIPNKWGNTFSHLKEQNNEPVVHAKRRQRSFTTEDILAFIGDLKVVDNRNTVETKQIQLPPLDIAEELDKSSDLKMETTISEKTEKKIEIDNSEKDPAYYRRWYELVTQDR